MSGPILPKLTGRTRGKRIPVYLGDGLLDHIGIVLRPVRKGRTIEVVTDRHVRGLLSDRVTASLQSAGWFVNLTVLSAGEQIKRLSTVTHLHERWFELGYDRQTPVITLGGGTIGDAVGFAAATFMRGLPLWQVPTTIVAQVDAAIGGKVGVNHRRGKNLIGCIYQSQGIVIDPSILATLPVPERRSGLAEIVKYGVIADRRLFALCEKNLPQWINGTKAVPGSVIEQCVKIKLRVVAADETDVGLRRILNFGHTIGHALERWANYRGLRHGEAVAAGMVGAGWMAVKRRLWTDDEFTRLTGLCQLLCPMPLGKIQGEEVTPFLRMDKKRTDGRNIWIIPRAIGQVEICDDLTEQEVSGAVEHVCAWLHQGV